VEIRNGRVSICTKKIKCAGARRRSTTCTRIEHLRAGERLILILIPITAESLSKHELILSTLTKADVRNAHELSTQRAVIMHR